MKLEQIDRGLEPIWTKIAKLDYVNPINQAEEKSKFFKSQTYNPRFQYRKLDFNPSPLKKKLLTYKKACKKYTKDPIGNRVVKLKR